MRIQKNIQFMRNLFLAFLLSLAVFSGCSEKDEPTEEPKKQGWTFHGKNTCYEMDSYAHYISSPIARYYSFEFYKDGTGVCKRIARGYALTDAKPQYDYEHEMVWSQENGNGKLSITIFQPEHPDPHTELHLSTDLSCHMSEMAEFQISFENNIRICYFRGSYEEVPVVATSPAPFVYEPTFKVTQVLK